MAYGNDHINFSIIKEYCDQMSRRRDFFRNSILNDFENSYIGACSDPYILKLKQKLLKKYQKIQDNYNLISLWWVDYCLHVKNLEQRISKNSGPLNEPLLNGYVSQHFDSNILKSYIPRFAPLIVDPSFSNISSRNLSILENVTGNSQNDISKNVDKIVDGTIKIEDYFKIDMDTEGKHISIDDLKAIFNGNIPGINKKVSSMTGAVIGLAILQEEIKRSNLLSDFKQENGGNEKKANTAGLISLGALPSLLGGILTGNIFQTADAVYDTVSSQQKFQEEKEKIISNLNHIKNKSILSSKLSFKKTFETISDSMDTKLHNTAATISNQARSKLGKPGKWIADTAIPLAVKGIENYAKYKVFEQSTKVVAVQSTLKGLLHFGEALVDTGAIVIAIQNSPSQVLPDLIDFAMGNEPTHLKELWAKTMSFVSVKGIDTLYDHYYNTSFAKTVNQYSLIKQDGTVANILDGVGYTAGIIGVSILTCGFGGAAIGGTSAAGTAAVGSSATTATTSFSTVSSLLSGIAGFGKGTETSWADGANLGQGLTYGAANGLWEGFQYWIGNKIGLFGSGESIAADTFLNAAKTKFYTGTGSKLLNSFSRIAMDSIDGGVEGIIQPFMKKIYKDKKYQELFEENGGWSYVLTNATVGSVTSAVGETSHLTSLIAEQNKATNFLKKESAMKKYVIRKFDELTKKVENIHLKHVDEGYKVSVKTKEKVIQGIIKDINDAGYVPKNLGEMLKNEFSDPNYIFGVHRAGHISKQAINNSGEIAIKEGLNLTGHLSSGVISTNPDLELNISFYDRNSALGFPMFLKGLKEGAYYKTFDDRFGASVIVKIPKADFSNYDKILGKRADGMAFLKPEYIMGYVKADHGNLSDLITSTNKLNTFDLKTTTNYTAKNLSSILSDKVSNLKIYKNELFPIKEKFEDIFPLDSNKTFEVDLGFEKTSPLISISVLESLLNDKKMINKFKNFSQNKNIFGNFSKETYVIGLSQFADELKKYNVDFTDTMNQNVLRLKKISASPNIPISLIDKVSNLKTITFDSLNKPFSFVKNKFDGLSVRLQKSIFKNNQYDYFEFDQNQPFEVSTGLDRTAKLIPYQLLNRLLSDEQMTYKLNHFSDYKNTFGNFSREMYVTGLNQFVEVLKKYEVDFTETMKKNAVRLNQLEKGILVHKIENERFIYTSLGLHGSQKPIPIESLNNILSNDALYQKFLDFQHNKKLFADIEEVQYFIAFQKLTDLYKKNDIPISEKLGDRLSIISNRLFEKVNSADKIFQKYDKYGADQASIRYVKLNDSQKYQYLIEKVQNFFPGMNKQNADKFLSGINNQGVCSYTSYLNQFYLDFDGSEFEFEKNFGFKMYEQIGNQKILNDSELLLDLYMNVNKGNDNLVRFDDVTKQWSVIGTDKDVGCIIFGKIKNKSLEELYPKIKNHHNNIENTIVFSNRGLKSLEDDNYFVPDQQLDQLKSNIQNALIEGQRLNMGVYRLDNRPNAVFTFRSKDRNVCSANWNEGVGHGIIITGMTPENELIVSSWGKKYTLSFDEIRKTKFDIFATKINGGN